MRESLALIDSLIAEAGGADKCRPCGTWPPSKLFGYEKSKEKNSAGEAAAAPAAAAPVAAPAPAKKGRGKPIPSPEEIERLKAAKAAEKAAKAAKTPPTAAKPAVAVAKAAAAPQAKAAAARAEAGGAPAPKPAAPSSEGIPATQALYQTDTYLFTCEATVLAVQALDGDTGGWDVLLDATCFHPQGGGQPADTGTITSVDGGAAFEVSMVKKEPSGVVRHTGSAQPGFSAGARVRCSVDESGRVKNARVHSAGHLIDVAMTSCGMADKLRPTKGYHFTPGAYVEYDGKLDAAARDELLPRLQASMDELIGKQIATEVKQVDAQQLDTACPPNALPADKSLWGSGWVRVVCVGGLGCPCGGTHVRDTAELGKVVVTGLKGKGKVTRVSYTIEGIA